MLQQAVSEKNLGDKRAAERNFFKLASFEECLCMCVNISILSIFTIYSAYISIFDEKNVRKKGNTKYSS